MVGYYTFKNKGSTATAHNKASYRPPAPSASKPKVQLQSKSKGYVKASPQPVDRYGAALRKAGVPSQNKSLTGAPTGMVNKGGYYVRGGRTLSNGNSSGVHFPGRRVAPKAEGQQPSVPASPSRYARGVGSIRDFVGLGSQGKTQFFTLNETSRRENVRVKYYSEYMFATVGLSPEVAFGDAWHGDGCYPVIEEDIQRLNNLAYDSSSCDIANRAGFNLVLCDKCNDWGIRYAKDEGWGEESDSVKPDLNRPMKFQPPTPMGTSPGGNASAAPRGGNPNFFNPEFTSFGREHLIGHADPLEVYNPPHSPASQEDWGTYAKPGESAIQKKLRQFFG